MISVATGVDLVEIGRFQSLDHRIRERFFKRVFTPAELNEANDSLQHLAGKFAAKEAAAKALGCGIGKVNWQHLEILKTQAGKPELILHEQALLTAQTNGWTSWSVSISHTQTQALASVTALVETSEVPR